mgnify:CR=1 FL=1
MADRRCHAGLANKTFIFYTTPKTGCSGSCESNGKVHLSSSGVNKRFIIVHEMGHIIDHFVGDNMGTLDYDADEDGCVTDTGRNHEMASKEWQSAAIREGWAHFYAAVSFNVLTQSDCGFVYYKSIDYDLNGTTDAGSTYHDISCEQGPDNLFTTPTVDAKDYLGDWCSGTLSHRSTELDWLRFWWDFVQEESTVEVEDAAEILGLAIQGDFTFPSVGAWIDDADGSDAAVFRPGFRMRESADALGFLTEWDDHDNDNGVHR